ncbi:MAG: hypothetical protein L0220_13600 [Acidobacteria bacterium]|nr:hypothetical protein [Acidobacteriota bacterium]
MKISILLRVGIVTLGLSLSFLAISLLQATGIILPVPNPWRSPLIIGAIGAILIILAVLRNEISERRRP